MLPDKHPRSLLPHVLRFLPLVALSLLAGPHLSAEVKTLPNGDQIAYDGTSYDFRDAAGEAMIKAWVPPEADPVRGIFISGHGGGSGDSRNFTRDENMRALAARFRFGLVGLHNFPGRRVYTESAPVFFGALDAFAAMGHHPELAHVPFVIYGSSNGGAQSYGLAASAPERCIAFLSNVSYRMRPEPPPEAVLGVPGLFVLGRFDPFGRGMEGVDRMRNSFAEARARGARWALVIEDKGHAAHSARGLYLLFVVTDNLFLNYDPDLNGYIKTDCIDVLLDSRSASFINNPENAPFFLNWGLLLSTKQLQVAFGRDNPPPMMRFNYPDPWDMHFHFESFAGMERFHGIEVHWIKLDNFHRAQEWFLPWSAIGQPGDITEEPVVGTRLAFTVSYIDRDQGGEDSGLPKQLTWIDQTTPWMHSATRGESPKGWGDIEIGPMVGAE